VEVEIEGGGVALVRVLAGGLLEPSPAAHPVGTTVEV
jgi:hypothetical protein